MYYLLLGIIAGPALATIATAFGTWLIHTIFHVLVFEDNNTVFSFDQYLQKHKATGPRRQDGKIAVGWHWTGLILAEKVTTHTDRGSRTTYRVYCLRTSTHESICKYLNRDADKVDTEFEEKLAPYNSTTYRYNDARSLVPYTRQAEIINDIVGDYLKRKTAFFLISGGPRIGKTTIGELVGRQLRKETNMKVVKATINLAAPGKGVLDYFWLRDPDTILILVMNEYDVTIKTAMGELPYENKEVTCHAATKTSLNDLFDFFGQQERLVIIATTNDQCLPENKDYASFIGRFNKVVKF